MNRRRFIRNSFIPFALLPLVQACVRSPKKISGKIVGASSDIGHLLRDKDFTKPTSIEDKEVVIIGGGISGLSAARELFRNNIHDFTILELEKEVGGNAAIGHNEISAYPWGAHYVPLPNNDLKEYLDFLEESGAITGYNPAGLPIYNEFYLCFDPQERLYINGKWQEGLVPHFGVPANDVLQIKTFLKLMDDYRQAKGTDEKDAFSIPINNSSKDEQFTILDSITMQQWMQEQKLTSTYLQWFVNYSTRDDFGTTCDKISAWTGIHYFAARKGKGANAKHHDTLTWPAGNGWLVQQLKQSFTPQIQNNCLAVSVEEQDQHVLVTYLDVPTNQIKAYRTKQCLMAVPQFIAARMLHDTPRAEKVKANLHYTPWAVANLKLKAPEERSGLALCWDNVMYESKSLGYVNATHQLLDQKVPVRNYTWYLPLTDNDPVSERKLAQKKTHEDWVKLIINDLKIVHPDIEAVVENIDVQVWGHAMAQPLPGIAHGNVRHELAASINNRIHFAHTDLAGISIFEEAFYQGLNAAKTILQNLI